MKKRFFKKIRNIVNKIPAVATIVALAVFTGIGAVYFVNSSPRIALLRRYFPGFKMVWLFLGVAGMAIAMQLFSIAFERLLGKLRDYRAERRGSTK